MRYRRSWLMDYVKLDTMQPMSAITGCTLQTMKTLWRELLVKTVS